MKAKEKLDYTEAEEIELKEDRKATNTAFIMLFPALIISAIAVLNSDMYLGSIAIMLAIYQFVMAKKFIVDYYRK